MTFDDFPYVVRHGERLSGTRVELDGNWFTDCRFERCQLTFHGERPYGYVRTAFVDCQIVLLGRAQMVFSRLAGMLEEATLIALAREYAAARPDLH